MASMMRCLGYPKNKALFTAWIDGLAPGQHRLRHGPVPEELRCKAVVAVASGGPESCEVATELDVDPSAVGKLEAADARPVRGEDHDRTDHEARKAWETKKNGTRETGGGTGAGGEAGRAGRFGDAGGVGCGARRQDPSRGKRYERSGTQNGRHAGHNCGNILRWHRIKESHGGEFSINGFLNHYPDFLSMTRTGRILAIETKGEMLKGDDSRDKLSLGNMWANAAGDGYRYFMVFENDPLDGPGSYTLKESERYPEPSGMTGTAMSVDAFSSRPPYGWRWF